MKKHILLLTLLLAACLQPASGQTYKKLWAQVEAARKSDLPKTALPLLETIRRRALAQGDDAQLLRATLVGLQFSDDVAPDSGSACLQRMAQAMEREQRPEVKALWQSALGQLYHNRQWADTAYASRSRQMFNASMQQPEVLSEARASSYLPLFVLGSESDIFRGDLLHVVAHTWFAHADNAAARRAMYGRLTQLYGSRQNRAAVLWWKIDSLRRETTVDFGQPLASQSRFRALKGLLRSYVDLPQNVLTYVALAEYPYAQSEQSDSLMLALIRQGLQRHAKAPEAAILRNAIAEKESASLALEGLPAVAYPGQAYKLALRAKAVQRGELRIYRLAAKTAAEVAEADVSKLPRTLEQTLPFSLPQKPAYASQTDTLALVLPKVGAYCVALYDGKKEVSTTLVCCSRYQALVLDVPQRGNRIKLVDTQTGTPQRQFSVEEYRYRNDHWQLVHTHQSDHQGNVWIEATPSAYRTSRYAIACQGDAYQLPANIHTWRQTTVQPVRKEVHATLFTDRGIYRPGQTLSYSAVVYEQRGDSVGAATKGQFEVRLFDGHGKEVAKQQKFLDEMGTFCGEFSLPQTTLLGHFRLEMRGLGKTANHYVRVEEYKRPTFRIELDEVAQAYAPGDTVMLRGTVKTYSNMPVGGARVHFATRSVHLYWRHYAGQSEDQATLEGDTLTDEMGRFCVPVVLSNVSRQRYGRTAFHTTIDVTAPSGETASESHRLYVARRKAWLTASLPATVCREQGAKATVTLQNAAGQQLPASGTYQIMRGAATICSGTFESGQPFSLSVAALAPSGRYTLVSRVDTLCDTVAFTSFSELDTRLADASDFWTYERRLSDDSLLVWLGTSQPEVTLFCDIVGPRGLIESRQVVFSDSILRLPLVYKPQYGDAVVCYFAFVKNGKLHTLQRTLQRPRPHKKLQAQWQTFRSQLTPGEPEVWRLRLTHADGRPARAALMARLYDASLNALENYEWNFAVNFERPYVRTLWTLPRHGQRSLFHDYPWKEHEEPDLTPSHWDGNYFETRAYGFGRRMYGEALVFKNERLRGTKNMRVRGMPDADELVVVSAPTQKAAALTGDMSDAVAEQKMAEAETAEAVSVGFGGPQAAVKVRQNFAETAFFMPQLRADEDGVVTLRFVMPESLTQWNFQALAHTAQMDYALCDTTAVARKQFMVETALPRFVRRGDVAFLPATLRSLIDRPLQGTLSCTLINSETGKTLWQSDQPFAIAANSAATAQFEIDTRRLPATANVVVCRIVAQTSGFSDGEERYLPILDSRQQVVRALPFALSQPGTQCLRVDTLWAKSDAMQNRRLTVEVSSNPVWYAVSALPVLSTEECHGPIGWMRRLYALSMAAFVAQSNPDIVRALPQADTLSAWQAVLSRNDELKAILTAETPWLLQAESEAERAKALRTLFDDNYLRLRTQSALDRLRQSQMGSGAWSWFDGMHENTYITLEIATMMARVGRLTGNDDTQPMFGRAMNYLDTKAAEYVSEAKKHKFAQCSAMWLRYLYVNALAGRSLSGQALRNAHFLLDLAQQSLSSADMHLKALAAVALAHYGREAEAKTALQSLVEHTVSTPQMGRYFDTRRALISQRSYRIPTQVATIEALQLLKAHEPERQEMLLWLMQSKRSQIWETSLATTDALYALLTNGGATEASTAPQPTVDYILERSGKYLAVSAPQNAQGQTGYQCQTYTDAETLQAETLRVGKKSTSLSWGSVFATYTLPMAQVENSGGELAVERRVEAWSQGRWQPAQTVTVGQRLRMVFTITARRDFDYVALTTGRAACLEPTAPLSGYCWTECGAAYRVVRDADTQIFIEKLPKGTHTIVEELRTDRKGSYLLAPARLQSQYAPEFVANTASQTIEVH
ncbi:MAG: alpha-2-macroglobulin family protein [Bacteroidaceae bacterium]|nr:alpha-2-macroglobulin family protein [Bacteroidaceae bacterium]